MKNTRTDHVGIRLAVLTAVTFCGSCGSREPAGDEGGAVVTDSAGVTIVSNPTVLMAAVPAWTLSEDPQVVIGDESAGDEPLNRIQAVVTLGDGRVAVANGMPPQVVVYGADGGRVAMVGRPGEGPGEFRGMSSLVERAGDSLAVWDPGTMRLSVFSADGSFGRSMDLRGEVASIMDAWTVILAPPEGPFVVFPTSRFGNSSQPRYRPSAMAHVVRAGGEGVDSIGPFLSHEMFRTDWGYGPLFFGVATYPAIAGESLLLGDSERTELRWYTLDGSLERIARWPDGDRPLSEEAVAAVRAELDEGIPDKGPRSQNVDDLPFPDVLPAFGDVFTDAGGRIWVGEYPEGVGVQGMNPVPQRSWIVFNAEGAVIATAVTPAGFELKGVRDGRAWGVFRDELGVETVRAYALVTGDGD